MKPGPLALALARLASPLAGVMLVAAACSERPEPPSRANPFDPRNGETGGAAFQLTASRDGRTVLLAWTPAAVSGLTGVRVDRRSEGESDFTPLDTLAAGEIGYRDETPSPDARIEYRVIAVDASGAESSPEASPVVSIDLPPHLEINPGMTGPDTTSIRLVRVTFFSERADTVFLADSLRVEGTSEELVGAIPFVPDPDGYDYLLPANLAQDVVRSVYGRIRRQDGTLSPAASDNILISPLRLEITLDGRDVGPVVSGRRTIPLGVEAHGADSMRVGFERILEGPWDPFQAARSIDLASPDLDTLFVEVMNAFGATDTVSLSVSGDLLASARIEINGGAAQTASCVVTLSVVDGHALGICFLDSLPPPTPADTCDPGLLIPFEGSISRELPPGEQNGYAPIYARLANEWVPGGTTRVLADSIWLLADPADCAAGRTPPAREGEARRP